MSKQFDKNKIMYHKLEDIDELCVGVFIIKNEMENMVCCKVNELGGRVLSSVRAQGGYSVSTFSEIFSNIKSEYVVVFSALRKEDSKNIVEAVAVEFNLDKRGNGKAFVVDTDGYLGAKGAFLK